MYSIIEKIKIVLKRGKLAVLSINKIITKCISIY